MRKKSRDKLLRLAPLPGLSVIALCGAATLAGCGNQSRATGETADHQHADGAAHDAASATAGDAMPGGLTARTTKLEFKTQPKAIAAGEQAIWTLKIFDKKTGEPVRNFDTVHERMLHLIVVSKDLSWFNHIHPEYKDRGLFIIRTSVPRAGTYKLYADYTPKDGTPEVAQHEISVGNGSTPAAALTADKAAADKADSDWIVKRTTAAPEHEPQDANSKTAPDGPAYQIALMPMPAKIVAGKPIKLRFQVRDAAGQHVTDLEPYLGAMGHLVIVSSDTNTYLHAHPMAGGMEGTSHGDHAAASSSPDVMFHTNFPTAGLYKAWGQFKHKGLIIAAPFVLRVEAGVGAKTHAATTK